MGKPPRTLGLSFAILAGVMLFSVLPLMGIAAPLLIQYRVNSVAVSDGAENVAPFAVGAEYLGISNTEIVFQVISSMVFLGIALLAWRGRPRWIRAVMIGAVLVLLAVTVITNVAALNTPAALDNGMDSGQAVGQSLMLGRLVISGFVALYVLWYMNRGPARAFYRGYYLQRDGQVHDVP